LNLTGNGVLPLSQSPITDELSTLIPAMDKHYICPVFNANYQVFGNFQELCDRSYSNVEFLRRLEAAKQICHRLLYSWADLSPSPSPPLLFPPLVGEGRGAALLLRGELESGSPLPALRAASLTQGRGVGGVRSSESVCSDVMSNMISKGTFGISCFKIFR